MPPASVRLLYQVSLVARVGGALACVALWAFGVWVVAARRPGFWPSVAVIAGATVNAATWAVAGGWALLRLLRGPRVCPDCRRSIPYEEGRCPECGAVPVWRNDTPAHEP